MKALVNPGLDIMYASIGITKIGWCMQLFKTANVGRQSEHVMSSLLVPTDHSQRKDYPLYGQSRSGSV